VLKSHDSEKYRKTKERTFVLICFRLFVLIFVVLCAICKTIALTFAAKHGHDPMAAAISSLRPSAVWVGSPTASSACAAAPTSSAFEPARSPLGRVRLFSKPTRAWPPSSAAAVTQAVSRRPKAQTLHDSNRGASGERNGNRSRGKAVRVSANRPS